jgi:predicted RNase H-like nuclease (RuvC/YqgF family)
MKKYLFAISLFLICANVFAQLSDSVLTTTEFHAEISNLRGKINTLEKVNSELQQTNSIQKKQIESINSKLSVAASNIQQLADSLHITVTNVSSSNKKTQVQIMDINQTITNRTLYWIIGILSIVLLSLSAFYVLRNKLSLSTKNLDAQIKKTNQTLQNEAIKLDSKLVEIFQTQLKILKEENKTMVKKTNEVNHKLPLKVGEEIHRMRKRIENMSPDIKGLSALTNSLQRLEEEFNESGYEIEELLGKKYVDGMKVEPRFVDNPSIPKGEEIITDVLKPQIMYKGVVVQFAKVEVGKSY